jgi:acetaldehyde dehydrogenase (acetylating)
MDKNSKLNVAIIGSGKIGTDLLIKVLRSDLLRCKMVVGRNFQSKGMKKAKQLEVPTSDKSIHAFDKLNDIDLVFDATSAHDHRQHAPIFRAKHIKTIDLTPAKVGEFCVPSIDPEIILERDNINMVTCGGQAAIPIIETLSQCIAGIQKISIESHLSEDSVGPATLANIDDYYESTAQAIRHYAGITDVHVNLSVEKSGWKPDMLTKISALCDECDLEKVYESLLLRLAQVREYVPGYHIVGTPRYRKGCIEILVSIRGQGDWIPSHAGNLDIINCAAICIAERFALYKAAVGASEDGHHFNALRGLFRKTGRNAA